MSEAVATDPSDALPGEGPCGLVEWQAPGGLDGTFWSAPAGTTAELTITGADTGEQAGELQWSSRAASIPSTRGIVLLDGPGGVSVSADFERAHVAVEAVAGVLTRHTGSEIGPIEVLCFRPDPVDGRRPRPVATATGVEIAFRHVGGADVHLTLTTPVPTGEA